MIENDKQYAITKNQLVKFKKALNYIETKKHKTTDPMLIKIKKDAIKNVIKELQEDIEEYEKRQ